MYTLKKYCWISDAKVVLQDTNYNHLTVQKMISNYENT
jgi:hypothetical protein